MFATFKVKHFEIFHVRVAVALRPDVRELRKNALNCVGKVGFLLNLSDDRQCDNYKSKCIHGGSLLPFFQSVERFERENDDFPSVAQTEVVKNRTCRNRATPHLNSARLFVINTCVIYGHK